MIGKQLLRKNLFKIIISYNWLYLLLYFIFYYIYFNHLKDGLNNYWDWTFPYFSEHVKNFFLWQYLSWIDLGYGAPISYTSDYFFRLLVSLMGLVINKPETLLFQILIVLFTFSSFGIFLIIRKYRGLGLSFLVGLICMINPIIFYKLIAGHLNYFVSFFVFIYFIYFIMNYFQNILRHYIIISLLFAFIGAQIQFFIFIAIFLGIYFLINKDKFSLKYSVLSIFIVIAVNLIWLSNFILGVRSLSETSEIAKSQTFSAANNPEGYINLLNLSFSLFTQIENLYPYYWLIFFMLLYFIFIISIVRNKSSKSKVYLFLISNLGVFLLMVAGFHNYLYSVPIISTFLPMLRESAHVFPIVFILLIVTIFYILPKKIPSIFMVVLSSYFLIFLLSNILIIRNNLPQVNYESVRQQFQPFESFSRLDQSTYRVLTYPFFSSYSFNNLVVEKGIKGLAKSNVGWDSYIIYSGKEYITNPDGVRFKDSLQYKFIKSDYDVSLLKKYNIKYIYDFQNIYTSNFDLYVPASTYDNDISIIKNDTEFFDKIIENNKGKVKLVSENILEIIDYSNRVDGDGDFLFNKINPTKYKIKYKNISENQKLDLKFLSTFHKDWNLYLNPIKSNSKDCNVIQEYNNEGKNIKECEHTQKFFEGEELSYLWKQPVFEDSHKLVYDYANQWTIDPEYIKANFDKSYYKENPDGSIDIELALYFKPQSYFYLGIIISGTTLILCLGYLGYTFYRKRGGSSIKKF